MIVPPQSQVAYCPPVVKIMVRAVAFLSGVEFLQEIGLGRIGDVVVADSPEAFEGEDFVAQFLVVLSVRILRNRSR